MYQNYRGKLSGSVHPDKKVFRVVAGGIERNEIQGTLRLIGFIEQGSPCVK